MPLVYSVAPFIPTCATCKLYDNECCRRYPPQVVSYVETFAKRGVSDGPVAGVETYTRSESPSVLPTDWCGEHQFKEPT